ncbi:UNVERIFIED_CONTAM: hypothetical protein K2H54_032344 [Gekko kuhli]
MVLACPLPDIPLGRPGQHHHWDGRARPDGHSRPDNSGQAVGPAGVGGGTDPPGGCCNSSPALAGGSQIPCSLEYWDELQKSFVAFREFSLSESKVCELPLPSIDLMTDQKELVASDLWRIVLNSNQNSGDDQRYMKKREIAYRVGMQ